MNVSRLEKFNNWLKKHKSSPQIEDSDKALIQWIKGLGVSAESICDIEDPVKVQLLASELIMKRDYCGIKNIDEFDQAVRLLVYYAEFLKQKDLPDIIQEKRTRDKTKDTLTVAYYLSRVNNVAVQKLGYKTFSDAFKGLAAILGQKTSTIKNMRDEYDPYFDNGRVGWYQRQLSASRKEIFDMYSTMSDSDLFDTVQEILHDYSESNTVSGNGHKRIKISSGTMKEFKAKNK